MAAFTMDDFKLENPQDITHVIFDMDGLLLDTVELYQTCHNKVLLPFGFHLPYNDIMSLMGSSALDVAENICTRFNLPLSKEEYREKVSSYYPQVFPLVKLMEGAERLINHLHKHNIPIAIASGGAKDSYDLKTKDHQKFVSLFHHVVLASSDEEVKKGKPAPDVFLVCAQRFLDKPEPHKCLVFEDAPNGVAAALAAGMQVIMVPNPKLNPECTKGVRHILQSLDDFEPHLFGLPPY